MNETTLEAEREVSLETFERTVAGECRPVVAPETRQRMESCRRRLESWADEGRRIYGVTTGFGPLADASVDPERLEALQTHLVDHLSTGVGEPMAPRDVRGMMVARTVSLTRGHSAVRPSTVDLIVALLEEGATPVVPSLGTVGASGDLTPLAHMTGTLMGRGEMMHEGEQRPSDEVLADIGWEPLELDGRDGLALVNGTSAMTGKAALNGVEAARAVELAVDLGALYAQCLGGHAEAWDPKLGEVRPHAGQRQVHDRLADVAESSGRLRGRSAGELPQDAYSIRCLPQLLGAVLDEVREHNRRVETELNSVTDNPVIFPEDDRAVHGGNFYGQHVAFASDRLAHAVLKIGIHAERCIARVTDPKRNGDLPPFLQDRQPGLQSGFMGAQVTASSLVGEMRSRSTPASVQSIPTNADNQDVVPMGTTAARRAGEHLDRLWEILAIEAMVLAEAYRLLEEDGEGEFADRSAALVEEVREIVPPLEDDRPLSQEIRELAEVLRREPREIDAT